MLDKLTFIVDPIDGTVNYAAGHFMSCISIAYVEERRLKPASSITRLWTRCFTPPTRQAPS